MNERTTGVSRPSRTAQSPQRANQRSARSSLVGVEMEAAPAPLEQRPAAVVADRPADERAEQVAERPGERDRQVRAEAV